MKFWNERLLPISLLAGTIIGAGVFSLPYVFKTTGFVISLLYALLFCGIAMSTFAMYADLLRHHPGVRYVGLMRTYFGKKGYRISFLLDITQLLLALTVYIVLSESFLRLIFPGYDFRLYAIIFWILGSVALFVKNKKEALEEFFALLGVIAVIVIIAVLGFKRFIYTDAVISDVSLSYLFLPFGALLFSFSGRSVIPDLVALTKGNKDVLRVSIIGGTIIPLVLYVLFVIGVFGLSPSVSPDAISGLIGNVHPALMICIGFLGVLALWSSYIAIGENIRRTLFGDVGIPHALAGLGVVLIPIVLFLAGLQNFIVLIALIGGLLTATEWVCIALMWRKSFLLSESDPKHNQLLFQKFSPALFVTVLVVLSIAFIYTLIQYTF